MALLWGEPEPAPLPDGQLGVGKVLAEALPWGEPEPASLPDGQLGVGELLAVLWGEPEPASLPDDAPVALTSRDAVPQAPEGEKLVDGEPLGVVLLCGESEARSEREAATVSDELAEGVGESCDETEMK